MVWFLLYLAVAVAVAAWLQSDRSADGPFAAVVVIALCWPLALAFILFMVAVSLLIALWHRVGCR
jgi:hypothetical protein